MPSSPDNWTAIVDYLESCCESVIKKLNDNVKPVESIQATIRRMIQFTGKRKQKWAITATPEEFLKFIETPRTPKAQLLSEIIENKNFKTAKVIEIVRRTVRELVTKHLSHYASGAGSRLRGEE